MISDNTADFKKARALMNEYLEDPASESCGAGRAARMLDGVSAVHKMGVL